jgi:hypothetical protein
MSSFAGGADQPEKYDATNYGTVANAIAAIATGFLTVTFTPLQPSGAAGVAQTIALNTSQIKAIEQI